MRRPFMSAKFDLLFHDVLYPLTEDYGEWARGDLAIADGLIVDLGRDLPHDARRIIAPQELVLLPGLYNLHTHGQGMFWRGARDWSVDDVRPEAYRRLSASISTEALVSSAAATYATNVLGGVTFIADHIRREQSPEPFTEAMRRIGVRGRVHSHEAGAGSQPLTIPHETSPDFEAALEKTARLERRPIMIHAQETQLRYEHVLRQFKRSTVELLEQYGLLHDQTFLVHMGYSSGADLELIAARGAHVVTTPASEMRLGENMFDPVEAERRGISLLIGTDGPAYHPCEDLFADLKVLSLRSSLTHGPGRLRPGQILAMATWKAARSVGRPHAFPRAGAVADVVLLNGRDLGLFPLVRSPFDNVAQQLVHAATRAAVRFVSIGGLLLVEDGRPAGFDAEGIFDRFRHHARHYFDHY